jgi:hypothetical protein
MFLSNRDMRWAIDSENLIVSPGPGEPHSHPPVMIRCADPPPGGPRHTAT